MIRRIGLICCGLCWLLVGCQNPGLRHAGWAAASFLSGPIPSSLPRIEGDLPGLLPYTDELGIGAGLRPLRTFLPDSGEYEIRIWSGFGLQQPHKLLRLKVQSDRRVSGEMWLSYFSQIDGESKAVRVTSSRQTFPVEPDWSELYFKMKNIGLLSLSGDSKQQSQAGRQSQRALLVEINADGIYRAYQFSDVTSSTDAGAQIYRLMP